MAIKILALDLGQKTGWAARTQDGLIVSGTHLFKLGRYEGGGMIWLRFRTWLEEITRETDCDAIVFEEVRMHRGLRDSHSYGGFLAHLTAFAEGKSLPYQGVHWGTIKKFATGRGNAGKQDMIDAMVARGHNPSDDNEADALSLLHWALEQYGGGECKPARPEPQPAPRLLI